jgi:hypothetical protein
MKDFTQTFEKDVVPTLRKQAGFRDEIVLGSDDNSYVTAISLWDSKEQAESYNTSTYPAILKTLDRFLLEPPKVRLSSVLNSTSHKVASTEVVAA